MIAKFAISVCKHMEGQKRPILSDGVLCVSPAMADLIENSSERDLEYLMQHLHPIEIPGLFKTPVIGAVR